MPPAAVLFDLDDTLADRAAGLRRYARVFARDFADALHPCPARMIHETLLAIDDFGSLRQSQALCTALPWRAPVSPGTLFDHWAGRFGQAAVAFDDAELVLGELRRRDIRMGLVTNGGSAMQRSKIAALGLDRYMAAIVISDEVGLRKPDAAIFRRALAALGCAASDAWFVGDNPDLDVRAAHDAGLKAFWVRTGAFQADDGAPGRKLKRLGELLEHLDEPGEPGTPATYSGESNL
jgi:putative hydrolase of the HAD superfamily